MPTYIKELPSKEWLCSKFYVEDGFVLWLGGKDARGRCSVKEGKRINTYIDDCGYYRVVINRESYPLSRIIYQMVYGDLTPQYEIDHIDKNKANNNIENLRKVEQGVNKRNKKRQRNGSNGGVGVCLCKKRHPAPHDHKITNYWVARWYDLDGKLIGKAFNADKLGNEKAHELATAYREKMIAELNEQGAGYTDDHGKVP